MADFSNWQETTKDVMEMAENDFSMLNSVYREITMRLGIEVAKEIHSMFKGQQISFPIHLCSPKALHKTILDEYDGTNLKELVSKYGYSEKTIRKMISEEDLD